MNQDSTSGSGIRRLRDRQRESTANEILSAAERVFIERGFFETHMAHIAASAGVAVGTLYNHYKDRDALLNALMEQRRVELLGRLDDVFTRTGELPFREQLRETLRVIFTHFDKHFQFFATFTQAECGPPLMAHGAKTIQREIYLRFDQLIDRGRKQRALQPGPAKLAPTLLMGIARSMLVRRFFVLEETSSLAHLDTVVDFFFAGAGGSEADKDDAKPKAHAKPKTRSTATTKANTRKPSKTKPESARKKSRP